MPCVLSLNGCSGKCGLIRTGYLRLQGTVTCCHGLVAADVIFSSNKGNDHLARSVGRDEARLTRTNQFELGKE